MAACTVCGKADLSATARFCDGCGTPLMPQALRKVRKVVTAVFCDVVDSTSLGESLGDPEALHRIMSAFFRRMTAIVEAHGGIVENVVGDAVKGTFGFPRAHEDDALRAVRAAAEMHSAVDSLNEDFLPHWGIELQTRIGINTGEVMIAPSSEGRPLVLGDPMNVVARLETAAAPGEILMGETTFRLVKDAVEVAPLEPLTVKGKSRPVTAYRLLRVLDEIRSGKQRTPTMVGRDREHTELLASLSLVERTQKPLLTTVVGPPGMGKSRLVAELRTSIGTRTAVLLGSCPSYGEHLSLAPFADMIRDYAGIDSADGPQDARVKLEAALDSVLGRRRSHRAVDTRLRWLLGLEEGLDAIEPEEVFEALSRFINALAAIRPLVLVFEDVHRAHGLLLDFLSDLIAQRGSEAILVICTARPELFDGSRQWQGGTRLDLEPLSPTDMTTLIESMDADAPLVPEMRSRLIERAAGNPLYAIEFTGMVTDGLVEGPRSDEFAVPETLHALVAARLDALPVDHRAIIDAASVIGRRFWAQALRAFPDTVGGVDAILDELETSTIVARVPDTAFPDADEWQFSHELLQTVAYSQIPHEQLAVGHRIAAEWIEQEAGDRVLERSDLVAHHFVRALDMAHAIRAPDGEWQALASSASAALTRAAGQAARIGDRSRVGDLLLRVAEILRKDSGAVDVETVARGGKLLVGLGRWDVAVSLLSPVADSGHVAILRDLGLSLCKAYSAEREAPEFLEGRRYLARAGDQSDVDALASLAGTWKGIDEAKVRYFYRRAMELDPADPYPLGNYIECEIQRVRTLAPIAAMEEDLRKAIARCGSDADNGSNLPWAFYDAGKFHLLLGDPYASLSAYAKAVDSSAAPFMIATSLASLDRLEAVKDDLAGYEWARRLLLLAHWARFPGEAATPMQTAATPYAPIRGRVVILAGSSDARLEAQVRGYLPLLTDAWRDFEGVVISGGTRQGVSRLAGDLGERYAGVHAVGYAPRSMPPDAKLDDGTGRYGEIRATDGESFSPLEPLTYWQDILTSGGNAADVSVVGLGGGRLARAEYEIALALGAKVGVVIGTGRAAEELLADPLWSTSDRPIKIDPKAEAIRAFLTPQ